MAGRVPGVLVSSTFYDLRQIRQDLASFIEQDLGYRALLSEEGSFPIAPDATTIENCRQRVEQDTDVLILIVGRRYGSIDPASGKSVTNLEYLAARAKRIPVYAFVERELITRLTVWSEAGRSALAVGTVDSPQLFEFVNQVRSVDMVWTNVFETAREIIVTLRQQLAYLMADGLALVSAASAAPHDVASLRALSGRAFRLALERPRGWEYLLLGQCLEDEIGRYTDLRRKHSFGAVAGRGEIVSLAELSQWMQARFEEATRMVKIIEELANNGIQQALGPPGQDGSVPEIHFVARAFAEVYREALLWASSVRRAHVPTEAEPMTLEMARLLNNIIDEIGGYGRMISEGAREQLAAPPGAPPLVLTIGISIPDLEAFERELHTFRRRILGTS